MVYRGPRDGSGRSVVIGANGVAYVDIPGGAPVHEIGTLGFAGVYLVSSAIYGAYESAVRGCGSGAVNGALGSMTLDAITADIEGVTNTMRFLLDCLSNGLNSGGGGGVPEY